MEEVVERSEPLLPGPAEALGTLLDVPVPDLEHGEGLPLLWHWVYLLDRPAQADLGPDGHPVRGTLPTPPGPGRRRMWAGGRVRANGSLRCGEVAIKERFSAKGPVRFWWTPENVYGESPHEIIDWFTMRKGGRYVPFVLWCRERFTRADGGSAILVETWGVPKKEIYALWAKCRPESGKDSNRARWIEVAPPEILPRRAG